MASIVQRNGKYLVRVTRKGHPQINKSFSTMRDARQFAATVEADIVRGTLRVDRADGTTYRQMLERYRREITPGKRGAGKEGYRIAALLKPSSVARALLDKLVSDLRPHHVATWRDARLAQVSPGTLKREWVILAHVLETARLDWGYSAIESPFKATRKPEVRDARDRRISQAELDAICTATQSAELAVFVRLAVETCARRGELLALEWRDVDLRKRVAVLRQTKNADVRTIPLSPKAVELLRSMPRQIDGRVFGLRPDSVTQAFRRAVDRARRDYVEAGGTDPRHLVGVRLHDARHEGCSRLAELGLSALEVAGVSGHKTLSLLNRYVHLKPEHLADKLSALVG